MVFVADERGGWWKNAREGWREDGVVGSKGGRELEQERWKGAKGGGGREGREGGRGEVKEGARGVRDRGRERERERWEGGKA